MSDLTAILNVLLGAGVAATVTAIVAAMRKWKSGEIVDDDAVIARLDRDNINLRKQLADALEDLEIERRKRWSAEDAAVESRRLLQQYEDRHE